MVETISSTTIHINNSAGNHKSTVISIYIADFYNTINVYFVSKVKIVEKYMKTSNI